jgi:hypothetical protein
MVQWRRYIGSSLSSFILFLSPLDSKPAWSKNSGCFERRKGVVGEAKLEPFAIHHPDQSHRVSLRADHYRDYTIIITILWNSYTGGREYEAERGLDVSSLVLLKLHYRSIQTVSKLYSVLPVDCLNFGSSSSNVYAKLCRTCCEGVVVHVIMIITSANGSNALTATKK